MSDERRIADTKSDPLALSSLIAWLRLQPPNKRYCYHDNGRCLISTYLSQHFGKPVSCDPMRYLVWSGAYCHKGDVIRAGTIPYEINHVAVNGMWTYAEALNRALALTE